MPVATEPTWDEGVSFPRFPSLSKPLQADTIIVGGGLTGVLTAYFLAQAGQQVVLLEKDRLGFGATGLTTAFLTYSIDTNLADVVHMFGALRAKQIIASHAHAIDIIEAIVEKEKIECEFTRCPNYLYANSESDRQALRAEHAAAHALGLSWEFTHDDALHFKNQGYLTMSKQGKFHPRKFLAALTQRLTQRGVQIFEETNVTNLRPGRPIILDTAGLKVEADQVVVATYAPFDKKLFFKKAFYTSYVLEAHIPPRTLPEGMYEDMHNPYHYMRIDRQADHDRLIIGGEDHRADVPVPAEKNFSALEEYLKTMLSNVPYALQRRWQGPIIETVDGLAYIGRLTTKDVYYATGFSGNGMTYGAIAAEIIFDHISKKENPWAALYRADRVPKLTHLMQKGKDYTGEMVGGALRNILRRHRRSTPT